MGAAALPALQFVGAAFAAKSAIEGLKEGNLFKAIAGGVGAYYGMSSLASGAAAGQGTAASKAMEGAAQQTAADTAGSNMADKFASVAGGSEYAVGGDGVLAGSKGLLSKGAGGAAAKVATSGAGITPEIATKGVNSILPQEAFKATADQGVTSIMPQQAFSPEGVQAATPEAVATTSGWDGVKQFGSDAIAWGEKNPLIASTMMQMGGGLLTGMAQEDMFEEKMKALEESRKRRQYWADLGFLQDKQYNPNTGWS